MPSIEKIYQQVKEARQLRLANQQAVEAASTPIGGTLGGFVGGLGGALADPAQQATLLVGGFGGSVATVIASEVATNAAAGAFVQHEIVNPQRAAFGEQQGSVVDAALIGGALGGLVGGAREGIGALATRALDRATTPFEHFDFSDEQLASMFRAAPDNPTMRAGTESLLEQAHYSRSLSYPNTEIGNRRFTGEASEIFSSLTGTQRVLASQLSPLEDFTFDNLDYHTQVVREQAPHVYERLEAATARVNNLDAQIVATQARIDGLTVGDALARIDEQTGDLVRGYQEELANPNLSNADRAALGQKVQGIVESVQATPTDLQPRIAEAEQRLANASTKAEQQAAVRDLDKLYKTAGEDHLQHAMDQVEIPLRKELQSLRASRKAAAKEFRSARNDMDARIAQVQAEERARELLRPTQGIATERGPIDVEALRGDRVETERAHVQAASDSGVSEGDALGKRILQTTEEIPPVPTGTVRVYHGGTAGAPGEWVSTSKEYAEQYAERSAEPTLYYTDIPKDDLRLESAAINDFKTTANLKLTPDEIATLKPIQSESLIDFDGLKLPPDFLVSDENGVEISVGKLFASMQEDEKLAEAVRICSL